MPVIESLVGVYHADGGLRGELVYIVGDLLGTRHCALCDITHSPFRRKPAWDAMVRRLGVPFELVHLNERADDVLAASGTATPCVLARVEDGLVLLLNPDTLDALGSDVAAFERRLYGAIAEAGFALPSQT